MEMRGYCKIFILLAKGELVYDSRLRKAIGSD